MCTDNEKQKRPLEVGIKKNKALLLSSTENPCPQIKRKRTATNYTYTIMYLGGEVYGKQVWILWCKVSGKGGGM